MTRCLYPPPSPPPPKQKYFSLKFAAPKCKISSVDNRILFCTVS